MEKKITVVAGPNGSGKTTFAQSYLTKIPDHPVFLNPDLIASGFAFSDFEKASFQAGRNESKKAKFVSEFLRGRVNGT
jgi:predicted ABC-type ATPase